MFNKSKVKEAQGADFNYMFNNRFEFCPITHEFCL